MRALPYLLERHPDCQVVIAGGDGVSYGGKPAAAPNWREQMLGELQLDASRVHFTGKIPYGAYRSLLQVSKAHVYLTYPFVLSWSMLEAMACGCALVASDTAPVREVIRDGDNGLLVDFFDPRALAARVGEVLLDPDGCRGMRQRAAESVREAYSMKAGIAGYRRLLGLDGARREAA
jgi:glycosyltransferase involved in cell wall biosynthesis